MSVNVASAGFCAPMNVPLLPVNDGMPGHHQLPRTRPHLVVSAMVLVGALGGLCGWAVAPQMSALWVSAGTTARTAPYAMGPSAAVQPLQPPVGLPGVPAAQPPQLTGSATALTPPSASFGEGSEVPLPEVLEPQAADASSEPDIVVDFLKLLTPAMYAVLSIGAVWQMWRHQTQSSQWAAAGPSLSQPLHSFSP